MTQAALALDFAAMEQLRTPGAASLSHCDARPRDKIASDPSLRRAGRHLRHGSLEHLREMRFERVACRLLIQLLCAEEQGKSKDQVRFRQDSLNSAIANLASVHRLALRTRIACWRETRQSRDRRPQDPSETPFRHPSQGGELGAGREQVVCQLVRERRDQAIGTLQLRRRTGDLDSITIHAKRSRARVFAAQPLPLRE